jgi:hypothetical protein
VRIVIDTGDLNPDKINEWLLDEIADELEGTMIDIFTDLTAPPPVGTPVDTGAARNSWQLDTTVRLAPEVYSTSPYIGKLNEGSSSQSPAGFVEAAIDKNTD